MLCDQVKNRGEAHRQWVTWVCVPGLNPQPGTVGGYAKYPSYDAPHAQVQIYLVGSF